MSNLVCSRDSASEGVCPLIPSIFVKGATFASRGNYIFHVNCDTIVCGVNYILEIANVYSTEGGKMQI